MLRSEVEYQLNARCVAKNCITVLIFANASFEGFGFFDSAEANVAQQLPLTFPFEYSPPNSPFIVVQASVNADFPRPYILDTGSGPPLLIAKWAAQKIELPEDGRTVRI